MVRNSYWKIEMTYPNLKQSIWLLVLLFLIQIGLMIPIVILGRIIGYPIHTSHYMIFVGLASFVLVVCYVLRRTDRTWSSWSDIMPIKAISWQLLFPIVVSILGLVIVALELRKMVIYLIPMPELWLNNFQSMVGQEVPYWLAFYATVIQEPIVDEVLFRGIILGGLLVCCSKSQAAILSTILFFLSYLNPWQFPLAFTFGLVFAWWFIQTGSLLPCLLGNALNSFLAVTLARSGIPGFGKISEALVFLPWWVDVCAVVLAVLGLRWFYQVAKSVEEDQFEVGVDLAETSRYDN